MCGRSVQLHCTGQTIEAEVGLPQTFQLTLILTPTFCMIHPLTLIEVSVTLYSYGYYYTGILAANGPFSWQNANIFLHTAVKGVNFLQMWMWFENFHALYMTLHEHLLASNATSQY